MSGVTNDKLREFASNDYYIEAWEKPVSFNFGAAIFAGVWLAYRKMYLYSLYYFISITLLYGLIYSNLDETNGVLDFAIMTIFFIAFGLFGTKIYLYFAESKVARISNMYGDPEEQKSRIIKAGGTNFEAAFLVGVFTVILYLIERGTFS